MKNDHYFLIFCVFCELLFSLATKADEYQIRYLNSKNIVIGNINAVKYMRFSDKDNIVWPKNEKNVYMRLWNITQHREEYRPPRKKNDSTITSEIGLYTKGTIDSDTIPMLDSLNFVLTTSDYNTLKFEARWVDDNYNETKAILPRSKDDSSVCLTREMLSLFEGQICEIEIYAYKPDEDDVLWKEITVEVMPLR